MELQKAEPEPVEAFVDAAEEAEPDKAKRETLLQKLSRLRVVERVQMALKGGRDERMLLIRDPCKVVQRAVLQSPQLSEQEVESFANMASLTRRNPSPDRRQPQISQELHHPSRADVQPQNAAGSDAASAAAPETAGPEIHDQQQ